jgi:hypothetical protein
VEKPLAVYVAASASPDEVPRVRAAIAQLRALGIRVTCTWPDIVAANHGEANPRDASHEDRRAWSTQDLAEIDAAHVLWFLVPTPPATTRGGWWEASHAHATSKHLIFSGDTLQSVFCSLGHEFTTDAAALVWLQHLRVAVGLRELATNAPAHDRPGPFDLGGEG